MLNFLFPSVIFLNAFLFCLFSLFYRFCLLFQHSLILLQYDLLFFCTYLKFHSLHFYFYEKFKPNLIDIILCEINLRGVLTTFYKVICVLASSETCTTRFFTSAGMNLVTEEERDNVENLISEEDRELRRD